VGNQGSRSVAYNVIYDYRGFYQPVDNTPTLNVVKAGSAVPVKFSLGGDQGLDIFAKAADGSSYPKTAPIACNSTDSVDAIEETVSASTSALHYDASTNHYVYNWKTEKAWAGTCLQLVLKFKDGTKHLANFRLTK